MSLVSSVGIAGSGICPGKSRPKSAVAVIVARLAACLGHRSRRCHRLGAGERLQQLANAVDVVAVAVGQEDVCQVAAVRPDPVDEALVLANGHEGVDQHGVLVSIDQRRGVRDPTQVLVVAGGQHPASFPSRRSRRVS